MTGTTQESSVASDAGGAVLAFPHRAADPKELRRAYDRYRAVTGSVAPDRVVTLEVAAARAALTRLLLSDGWDAPADVLERLELDEQMLRRPALSAC